jgi:hypothetical protein
LASRKEESRTYALELPLQERWGLGPHQKITPGLADKPCFTVKADRWEEAMELLDFYRGNQHLRQLGRALKGEEQAALRVEPRWHQLRHGKEKKVLEEIARLKLPKGEAGQAAEQEQGYLGGKPVG